MSETIAPMPPESIAFTRVGECMRVLTCPACGVSHAVPVLLARQRAAAGFEIVCPNGHAAPIAADDEIARMVDELERLTRENAELRCKLGSPAEAMDKVELLRRASILAARAGTAAYGQKRCKICGKQSKKEILLRNHLRDVHRFDLELMPVEAFSTEP